MSEKRKIDISLFDGLPTMLPIIFLLITCVGEPDLFDVLQEWCRRYMENKS